jgi:myo-inositol 2-dehydrogenase/D-chiro-inositol 1-dehydrogenase/scyllo-inositol 2-dehydrogenase (NAD+)
MPDVKLGLIGLGYVGQMHLRHGLKLSNAGIVAVADISKRALGKAKDAGIKKTYCDYKDLLKNPEIDAVIIALPTHLHLQCANEAAEAKKHIFMEKPIARDLREAKEIVSIVKKNSVKLMMGYPLRFDTEFRNLKQKIRQGTLGEVEIAYAAYVSSGPFFHRAEGYAPTPVPEWWFDKNLTGGGVLMDLGSHIINLLRWYFGEIIDIGAHLEHRLNMDLEDSAVCLAKFETGTVGIINVGWFSQEYQLKLELLGSVKHAFVNHKPSNVLSTAVQMLTMGTSRFHLAHYSELQYFSNCLIKDQHPSPSGQDGLRDLEAIFQAYRSEMMPKQHEADTSKK